MKLWHFWQRACGACAASKERRVEPGSTRYLKRTPPPPHSPPKYVCEGHVIVYVIVVYVRWDRNAPSTEAEQANEAAKQRKRGIVVVKLPILLSYSERQRDRPFLHICIPIRSDLRVRPNCVQIHQRGGATLTHMASRAVHRVKYHRRGYDSGAGQAVIRVSREHS